CDGRDVDWEAVARTGLTIVVYMGVARAAAIAAGLLRGGLPPSTPAVAIEDGTLESQRTIRDHARAVARGHRRAPRPQPERAGRGRRCRGRPHPARAGGSVRRALSVRSALSAPRTAPSDRPRRDRRTDRGGEARPS